MTVKKLTRVALILALMIVAQSLRLIIPVPPFVSIFLIGSLVNACLLTAVEIAGWRLALVPAVIAPIVAYLQQLLPLPLFIVPIAAANSAFVLGYKALEATHRVSAIFLATGAKFAMVYFSVNWLIKYIALPANIAKLLTMTLGWPQIFTGIAGGAIYLAIHKRLSAFSDR